MEVRISNYLSEKKEVLRDLINKLSRSYDYVSILGTDTAGKEYSVKNTGVTLNDSMWTERGFVIRLYNGVNYSEFSFNQLPDKNMDIFVDEIREKVESDLDMLKESTVDLKNYPIVTENVVRDSFRGNVKVMPYNVNAKEKLDRLIKIKDQAMELSDFLIDFRVVYEEVHVSKIFISTKKDLEQSYIWSQAYMIPIVRKDNDTKYYARSFSGLKGVEILDELEQEVYELVKTAEKLLEADRVKPGEYEVICSPEVSGLIAHEAFGHGVEMDMFVKNRAKAVEYLNKKVASELVTMHDGASSAEHVSSYLFDDEGTPGKDTIIIENGILKKGISDLLSALHLGTEPTGNGKRESFERKAYARMTNTFFAGGNDDLEEMIASIDYGYLLDGVMSGMEDPKNWGIQCMVIMGKEIKDGKLTGKIVSPVLMTGYVPDVLKSITMVSRDIELSGSGYCGKGYKEYVKVSSGGPYIKTKVRLG